MAEKVNITEEQFELALAEARKETAVYIGLVDGVKLELRRALNKVLNQKWRAQQTSVGNGEFQLNVYTNSSSGDSARRIAFAKKLAEVLNEHDVEPG